MRGKKDILSSFEGGQFYTDRNQALLLEVLLDIRELLIKQPPDRMLDNNAF
jgi:hypothetical protein